MEDVLTYMMGVIMYGLFAAMFGYEFRVVQEERALARRIKRARKGEDTPHPSPMVTPSPQGEGQSMGLPMRSAQGVRFFADAQNDREGKRNDRGHHQTFKGKIYKNDDYNINSAPSCSCMAPHFWKTDPSEKLEHDEGVHIRFAEVQKAYQDGECIATKEVYGCRKKEADADGR